jgi:arsenate reductase
MMTRLDMEDILPEADGYGKMKAMDDSFIDDGVPHRMPIEDVIDLHPFRPSEVVSVVEEYLEAAIAAGFHQVRLIHGKGKGIQRQAIAALLARHPMVESYTVAPPEAGGWGATVAWLRKAEMPARPVVAPKGCLKVLFLCTANACRSQMAEGWARALKSDGIEAHSAGVAPCYLHPTAVRVMQEAGVDITHQYSKHVDDLDEKSFDFVITLCDYADAQCPVFPGHGVRIHHPFEDPVRVRGSEDEVLAAFRETRDRIRAFVEGMPGNLVTLSRRSPSKTSR